jgi:hypothetical protein
MQVGRYVLTAALLLALALAVSACGGDKKESPHDAYAKQLSSACDDMRQKIEALGKPSDTPIAKVYPGTVKIGRAFLRNVAKLDPPAGSKARVTAMVREYGYYFDGLALAYALLTKRKSEQGFIQTAHAANANLNLAIGYANKLGATACARQPFD